jgi:hypothetical protein
MDTKHAIRHSALRLGMIGLLLNAVAVGSANASIVDVPGTPLPGTPGFIMTFDENGHATINGQPAPFFALPPGFGVGYALPGPVVGGQVVVFSPGDSSLTNSNGFSDLLTFQAGGPTGTFLEYESLLDDNSPPDLADVANLFMPATPFSVVETGPEGNNGFQWIATSSTTGATATYFGISDTPEPSTFILGGFGLLALFLIGRRRGALKKI